MANFTDSMKEAAFATSPREFDLSYSTTLEEIMEKLNARRAACQVNASRLKRSRMWTSVSGFS